MWICLNSGCSGRAALAELHFNAAIVAKLNVVLVSYVQLIRLAAIQRMSPELPS